MAEFQEAEMHMLHDGVYRMVLARADFDKIVFEKVGPDKQFEYELPEGEVWIVATMGRGRKFNTVELTVRKVA